jgi:FixJ family two-component response regulator
VSSRKPIIYIVDDNLSVGRALSLLLKSHGYEVEAFTRAADFLAFKRLLLPSCLILDIQLPDMNGLELQEAMELRGIFIPIVFITGHGSIPMSVKGMKAGAIDFLTKPFTKKKLLDAIRQAILKNKIQNKELAEISKIKRRVKTLSPRELEVFRLVARGMLSKQIAKKRGTVLQTIKIHRGRVMQKMQAKTLVELVHFAQKAGITPQEH